ncbi:MAG: hypothetical protein QNK37_06235 [Acidobacteriota bacterium]|nr:hypothetical protein [Acidobacteriota bacterium]
MNTISRADVAEQGIQLCREGYWDEGLFCLSQITDISNLDAALIGRIYSYTGVGIALRQNRIREGITLCERAVRLEFYDPTHYINLARTQMMAEKRRAALRTIKNGLRVDPGNKKLLALRNKFGFRRPNVVPFLKRDNPINYYLGSLRHKMLGPLIPVEKKPKQPEVRRKPPEKQAAS